MESGEEQPILVSDSGNAGAQIIAVQHEGNAGATMVDLVRKHRGTGQTRGRWKKQYGASEASEAKRLKVLEEERRKLKRLVAD